MTEYNLSPTADGSWTYFNQDIQEHYHNTTGAYTEAVEVYVKPSQIAKRLEKTGHLTILDPFLGLAYNSLATIIHFFQLRASTFPNATLTLIAYEHDREILARIPIAIQNNNLDDLKQFLPLFEHNIYYQTHVDFLDFKHETSQIHDSGLQLKIAVGDTRQLIQKLPEDSVDIIFHDAFSPRKQPELWTQQLFHQYERVLKPHNQSLVITYSASASIRKSFQNEGFNVYALPNLNHKVGTLACLGNQPEALPLSGFEIGLMNSRSGIPLEDNITLDLTRDEILQERQKKFEASSLPTSSSVHRQFHPK